MPRLRYRSIVAALTPLTLLTLLGGCPADAPEFTVETIFLRPTAEIVGTPAEHGFLYDERRIVVAADREVSIWHVRTTEPARGTVVILPGSDRNKSRYLIGLPVFVPNGFDVVLMDYEGFGESTASPLELERLTENGFAVVDYALDQGLPVIVFGISTGGPTALHVAAQREVAGVLLEAPLILSLEPRLWLERFVQPLAPLGGLITPQLIGVAEAWITPQVPDSFDTLKYAARVSEPKLVMHSRDDDVVPYTAGELVYAACPEPREFFQMQGGHGKMIELDNATYSWRINAWLDRVIGDR